MSGRKRTVQVKFYVTEDERKLIEEKMKLVPTNNMAAYLRKIAIDGYIIQVDHTDIKAMTAEIQKIGVNVNQIAHRVNATGNAYKEDIEEIKGVLAEIWRLQRLGKAPSLDKPQGFGELWECRPQKKCAVLCRKVSHGESAKFLYAHGRVVVFCRAGKPLLCVLPRGIGVDYAVFFFNGFLSLLSVCFLLSSIKGNQGKGQSLPFACPYSMGFSRVKVGSYFLRFALKISTLPLTRL